MKLKSYFADSVETAMDQASRELGADAMLVYSRQTGPDVRHLGSYEVVFGVGEPGTGADPAAAKGETPGAPVEGADRRPGTASSQDCLTREVGDLKRMVNRLMHTVCRANLSNPEGPLAGPLMEAAGEFVEAGLAEETVHELLDAVRRTPEFAAAAETPNPGAALRRLTRLELLSRLIADSRVGTAAGGPKVVAFVGPPGAGKTTALVKIAATYAVQAQKPAQIISADTFRVAAADQLRSYAAILGVGFQLFDTVGGVAYAIEEHHHKDLILIDTPGFGPHDLDIGEELAAFLRLRTDIDVQLTLPATMKASDLRRTVFRFERFRPTKLIFTKMDETDSPGTVVSEVLHAGLPVSFLANGQQIPEDMTEATAEALADLVIPAPLAVPAMGGMERNARERDWEERMAGRAAA